jgi:hypothetical protein
MVLNEPIAGVKGFYLAVGIAIGDARLNDLIGFLADIFDVNHRFFRIRFASVLNLDFPAFE